MQAFRVDDMTCGHCVSTITQALRNADQDATVTIDLAQHLVIVEPGQADAQALSDAISKAGFTPVPVQTLPGAGQAAGKRGCCGCGCGS